MKGIDIVNEITSAEMPDKEQVRDMCVRQLGKRSNPMRLKWSVAAAVLVACLVFASSAYAVNSFISMRQLEVLDTGGSFEFIVIPPRKEIPRHARRGYTFVIYFNRHNSIVMQNIHNWVGGLRGHDYLWSTGAQSINKLLEGELFTADGIPFYDLLVYGPLNQRPYFVWEDHKACDRGQALYNRFGEEIGLIQVLASTLPRWEDRHHWEPRQVVIRTVGWVERFNRFIFTYDDAAQVLGRDFRLPAVHHNDFETLTFRIPTCLLHHVENAYGITELFMYESPPIAVAYFERHPHFGNFSVSAENIRGAYEEPWIIYLEDGEITEFYRVAHTTVYRITGPDETLFVWMFDGLVYTLRPPLINVTYTKPDSPKPHRCAESYCYAEQSGRRYGFSCTQVRDIIRSMIE